MARADGVTQGIIKKFTVIALKLSRFVPILIPFGVNMGWDLDEC
jgi:hypothetical protein